MAGDKTNIDENSKVKPLKKIQRSTPFTQDLDALASKNKQRILDLGVESLVPKFVKANTGRPSRYDPEEWLEIWLDYYEYCRTEDYPFAANFTSRHLKYVLLNKNDLHQNTNFSSLRKLAIEAQERHVINKTSMGAMPTAFGIFLLKQPQHGYTDKQERELTGEVQTVNSYKDMTDEELLAQHERHSRLTKRKQSGAIEDRGSTKP